MSELKITYKANYDEDRVAYRLEDDKYEIIIDLREKEIVLIGGHPKRYVKGLRFSGNLRSLNVSSIEIPSIYFNEEYLDLLIENIATTRDEIQKLRTFLSSNLESIKNE